MIALYKRNAQGKPLVWRGQESTDGIAITIEYGLVGGNLHKEVINITKKNVNELQSRIKAKRKEGYKEISELKDGIDKTIFPGMQGGPLMHVIAAKAECFSEALKPSFKKYQMQTIKNAHALCETLMKGGFRIISGGTDNHLLLVDIKGSIGITGLEAEKILDNIHITVNKNTIPFDTEKPTITSGLRLGTPAMTTRGLNEKDFEEIGHIIVEALKNRENGDIQDELRNRVLEITRKYPLDY